MILKLWYIFVVDRVIYNDLLLVLSVNNDIKFKLIFGKDVVILIGWVVFKI